MRRTRGRTAVAAAALALALAGCSSQEELPVLGPDGSGDFERDQEVTATLRAVEPEDGGGAALGSARAEAAGDGVRLEVRLRDADPGRWRVAMSPGTACEDVARDTAGVDAPDLTVGEDGRGLLEATLDDVPLSELADGAALVLDGPGGVVCGELADY